MPSRFIDKDKTYNVTRFLKTLPRRHYYALGMTPLPKAPLAYKIGRLHYCINSWTDADPFMVASLWTEYILVVGSVVSVESIPPVPEKEELDAYRAQHIEAMKKLPPGSLIDSPLTMRLETYGPVVHQYYLQCLGCDVPDATDAFYEGLWDLYIYLLLETRDLIRTRYRYVFNKQLKLVPNFEL